MSNCINKDCRLCRNIVISTAVTVITVDGTDTLVIDIPTGFYPDCRRVCLVVAQTIPTTATITMPVSISIGGDTSVVYPIVGCDCAQITACAIRNRTKYGLKISTNATSAVFKSLDKLSCYPATNLAVIPAPAVAGGGAVSASTTLRATRKTTVKGATTNE
jgi:hypothetical protein